MGKQSSYTFNFRSFCIRFLIPLLVILLAIIFLFNYYFEKQIILGSQINGAYKINRIISNNSKIEIPIIGSSRAQGSIVPSLLGPNYFNYGIDGTGFNVHLYFIESELTKNKQTPLIINLDLEGLFNSIGDINNYLYNSENKKIKTLLGSNFNSMYSIPFLKYYGNFQNYFKFYLNSKYSVTKYIDNGGSFELGELSEERFFALVQARSKTYTNCTIDSNYALRIDSLIRSNSNRYFVFIVAPYHKSFFERYNNGVMSRELFSLIEKHPNVAILDYSKLDIPDSLFFNTTHLNYNGAIRFTGVLKNNLDSLFKFRKS